MYSPIQHLYSFLYAICFLSSYICTHNVLVTCPLRLSCLPPDTCTPCSYKGSKFLVSPSRISEFFLLYCRIIKFTKYDRCLDISFYIKKKKYNVSPYNNLKHKLDNKTDLADSSNLKSYYFPICLQDCGFLFYRSDCWGTL